MVAALGEDAEADNRQAVHMVAVVVDTQADRVVVAVGSQAAHMVAEVEDSLAAHMVVVEEDSPVDHMAVVVAGNLDSCLVAEDMASVPAVEAGSPEEEDTEVAVHKAVVHPLYIYELLWL
jgi:hypothetical protein